MYDKNKPQQIIDWANIYVPKFNELANKGINGKYYSFYTQSPLDVIESPVRQMIIGINPAGDVKNMPEGIKSVSDYLKGNPTWNSRFDKDGNPNGDWSNYVKGIHALMGQGIKKDELILDNDNQTVYTNLLPFQSPKGSCDLPKEFYSIGATSTLDLIRVLEPKRIILLGAEAFKLLSQFSDEHIVEYCEGLITKTSIKLGRIHNIPAYCVNHYTGQWAVSHYFTGIFMNLMNCIDIVESNKAVLTIEEVASKFNHEMEVLNNHITNNTH